MRFSHFAPKVGLALMLASGCGPQGGDADTGYQRIQSCKNGAECADTNADDPHQPRQGILDNFQMYPAENWRGFTYKVTGLYPDERAGQWKVRGYHISPVNYDSHQQADGAITMEVDGKQRGIYKILAPPEVATMSVIACDDSNGGCAPGEVFENEALAKITLILEIPSPAVLGGPPVEFRWTFADTTQAPEEPKDRFGKEVTGIVVHWQTKGINPTPLCKGPSGEAQLMVPQGHTLWHPRNFSRSQDPNFVTIGCEKGAIAYCRLWGYWEGYEFKRRDGQPLDKSDIQQSCINMKLANYCGSGPSQTVYGTSFVFNDPIEPNLHSQTTNSPEAIWNENGALCDDGQASHRHKEIPTPCAIPQCGKNEWSLNPPHDFVSFLPQ